MAGRANGENRFSIQLKMQGPGIFCGNLEMIDAAPSAGVTANFAGSGGAITGCYPNEATYHALSDKMRPLGVAVVKPIVA